MSDTYRLIAPVTVEKTIPGNERIPDRVERREVAEFKSKPIGGLAYFEHGPVTFVAVSPGGGTYEVELDSTIAAYLRWQMDDPDAEAILARLGLADAMARRQDLFDVFDAAEAAATAARAGVEPELIRLTRPFTLHEQTTRELRLKEPTHRMFDRFGKPFTWSRAQDGAVQPMERMSVIKRYIEGCVEHELGGGVVSMLCLADAIQLKRAILGFFTRAVGAVNTAKSSLNSSSKDDTSPSTPPTG